MATLSSAAKRQSNQDSDFCFFSNSHRVGRCFIDRGNAEAVSHLEEALRNDDTVYYDYMAIKNALEELGGEVTIERDFSGDCDYEALKNEAIDDLEE